jgi:hypothetical protein
MKRESMRCEKGSSEKVYLSSKEVSLQWELYTGGGEESSSKLGQEMGVKQLI